ncbi:UPF0561 protein C2orf68 homolog isoform X1 [Taeniopygia guttata]|uniref:UPF0561 protein C2orf68 homolog isoform X1 n=1 Tax=Taeniopygia guttata TaxID=59729 RepID=UPI003BB85B85
MAAVRPLCACAARMRGGSNRPPHPAHARPPLRGGGATAPARARRARGALKGAASRSRPRPPVPGMEAAAAAAAPGWRCRPGGRLDMSHGFVRHIRRNQLARDAYERAVRQARGRARPRLIPGPARPRRPDQPVYRPQRGGGGPGADASAGPLSEGGGAPPEPARGPRLFCLEYEGDDGRVTAVIVHQGDSAEEVTRRVCARSPLEPPLRRALCQRVQDELSKRRGTG